MTSAGFKPNVVVMTTLLKGYCAVGDLPAAHVLLESMARGSPPVVPDVRTLNTFLRGCVRAGDLKEARWAYSMLETWRIKNPGAPATVAFGRLLSQGLRIGDLRKILRGHVERGATPMEHRPTRTANPCAFWERGRCDRGSACMFYHNPAIPQLDARQVEAAHRDAELELRVQLAFAAALLGRHKKSREALARAEELQSNRYGTGMHASFRRDELSRTSARIVQYLDRSSTARSASSSLPPLDGAFCRCLIFSSRLEPAAGGCSDDAPSSADDDATIRRDGASTANRLVSALRDTMGLRKAAKLRLASKRLVSKRVARAVSRTGKLRWKRIFGKPSLSTSSTPTSNGTRQTALAPLPVKLEIASGTGDWVLAQAQADVGRASWASIELRHDRVYSTWSRMALEAMPNLCVMGGDAAAVVRHHLRPASVCHVFINFPEPPSGYLGLEEATNALHLLTASFFTDLARVLQVEGRLTIFSDNGRYMRSLAATIGGLRARDGASRLLASVELPEHDAGGTRRSSETISGVQLYHGVPGVECGHLQSEQSYFDRLWEYRQGEATERFYMLVRRPS